MYDYTICLADYHPASTGRQQGVLNPRHGKRTWYHTTLRGMVPVIMKYGLKGNCVPNFADVMSPYVFVSAEPFAVGEDYVTLAVDLGDWPWTATKVPVHAPAGELVLTKSVPASLLTVLDDKEVKAMHMADCG